MLDADLLGSDQDEKRGLEWLAQREAALDDSHDHVVVVGNDQRADAGPALQDAFAVSYNAVGRVLRSVWLTGTGSRNAVAVGVDDIGHSYITGMFLGELAVSTGTLRNDTRLDSTFVVKLPR